MDLPRSLGLKCSEPGVEAPMLTVVKEQVENVRRVVHRSESREHSGAGDPIKRGLSKRNLRLSTE